MENEGKNEERNEERNEEKNTGAGNTIDTGAGNTSDTGTSDTNGTPDHRTFFSRPIKMSAWLASLLSQYNDGTNEEKFTYCKHCFERHRIPGTPLETGNPEEEIIIRGHPGSVVANWVKTQKEIWGDKEKDLSEMTTNEPMLSLEVPEEEDDPGYPSWWWWVQKK